jgi:PhnB protein
LQQQEAIPMTNPATGHVTSYLTVRGADAAIEFYKQVFGAEEAFRLTEPGGRIGHAELKIGAGRVMLSDEYPEFDVRSPLAFEGTGSLLYLQVADVDAVTQRAVEAGATLLMEPRDQFYGERSARLVDPFGHKWLLGQPIEDVTPEQMQERFTAMFDQP